MLIGIDASRALRPQQTGTERYSFEIIRHLLALPEAAQHQWRLYVDQPVDHTFFAPPLHAGARPLAVECRHLPRRRLWTHWALAKEVVTQAPDVLFIPAHVLPFVLPPHRLPSSVVTVHDLGYHYFPEAHTVRQRLYLEISTRWNARIAQALIAVSQATAQDLNHFYQTPQSKIHIVYEAAATALSTPQVDDLSKRNAILQKYKLSHPYALYLGSIQPRKNLIRLIAAYNQLCEQHRVEWDLVLAGKASWLSNSLYEFSSKQRHRDQIRFIGYTNDEETNILLHESLMFCLPSLYEGFGLPVLEAQKAGVPIMTSNNSSLPEIAGDAAILVDPHDIDAIAQAMLRLSQDQALREKLIAAGYENAKRFSWEKAARETLAVLERVARGRQGDRVAR